MVKEHSLIELQGLKGLRELSTDERASKKLSQEVKFLPIEILCSGKYQPRKAFAKEELEDLANSIKAQGVIQPLIVRKIQSNQYEIIAGERRWRASQLAGLEKVPVICRQIDDTVALAFALIENIQRQDLNVIEEARAYIRFCDEFKMTHDEVAKYVGKSRTTITNYIRLLKLPQAIINWVEQGQLDMGHARCLLPLDYDRQMDAAKTIVNKKLSVRAAEKLVHRFHENFLDKPSRVKVVELDDDLATLLSLKFGKKAKVSVSAKGCAKLSISCQSLQELEKYVKKLCTD